MTGIIILGMAIICLLILIMTSFPGLSDFWVFTSASIRHVLFSIGIGDIATARIGVAIMVLPKIFAFFIGGIFVGYLAKKKAIICGILTGVILSYFLFLHTVSIYPTSSTFHLNYMIFFELLCSVFYVTSALLGAYTGKRWATVRN